MVGREEIAWTVGAHSGIPVTRMLKDEAERLLAIEEALHERVIGQDAAVVAVSETVRKARRPREPQPSHRPLHLLGTHWGR